MQSFISGLPFTAPDFPPVYTQSSLAAFSRASKKKVSGSFQPGAALFQIAAPPKKVPTFANYLVFGGAAVDGAPGTFPQVILTRIDPAVGGGAKVLQRQYSCRARAGEFGKRPHTRIASWRESAPTPI